MKKRNKQTKMQKYNKIIRLIPIGHKNAVSMRYLANILNTTNRDIREIIHRARLDGIMICGDDYGYYRPANEEELIRYYFRVRCRANTTYAVVEAIRKQLKIDGVDLD